MIIYVFNKLMDASLFWLRDEDVYVIIKVECFLFPLKSFSKLDLLTYPLSPIIIHIDF